ncbi:MAG: hypothetical protein MUF87_02475 [Anaerolineae bacterium]|nr:hypothetical protein [Anaerolineae bacterium]
MTTQELSFHVRHEVFPDRILEIIRSISDNEPIDTVVQWDRQLKRMRDFGLLTDDRTLTSIGEILLRVTLKKKIIWGELMHFLHYTTWNEASPYLNGFSWFYRTFCDYLFEQEGFKFGNTEISNRVCVQFNDQIEATEIFQPYLNGNPSLSANSITGIQHWLDALNPPVIVKNIFNRRNFCSPELLLLGIGWIFRDEPDPIGVPLLLSRPQREILCRLCLLDPKFFDRTLDWLIPRYPKVILSEEKAGFYGRSIRLRKLPSLEDLYS